MRQLQDKSAIITGGASGVGKAIAKRFASEGAAVTIADRNIVDGRALAESLTAQGVSAQALETNVADPDSVDAMIDKAVAAFGGIDIIVNSAAIARVEKVVDISFESWNEVLSVNLSGVFLCAQAAARYMQYHGGGRIINMSSVNGQRAVTGRGAYTVAKGGIEMLTRIMAAELGEHGITVNNIAPAPVDTPMILKMHTETTRSDWYRNLPIKRYAKPEEVAGAALFLASDDAAYVSGHTLNVDGGFNAAGLLLDL